MMRAPRTVAVLVLAFVGVAFACSAWAQITVAPADTSSANSGQTVVVPIVITNPTAASIYSFGMILTYPTEVMTYAGTSRSGTLTDSWFGVGGIENTPGAVTIGGFDSTPVISSGTLFNVTFNILPNVLGPETVTLSAFIDDIAGAATAPGTVVATIPPGAPGLLGAYYNNQDFTGGLWHRIDPVIDFSWGSGKPFPLMGKNDYSIRWTGWIRADITETYTFYTLTDDGVRLWVDGQLVIDQWVVQLAEWTAQVPMTAGQFVPITMEYFEFQGSATAKLDWSSPTIPRQTIPSDNMIASPCGQGLGDFNGDGALSSSEPLCAFDMYMAGGVLPVACNSQPFSCELVAGDANCDGKVTPGDALAIELRRLAGLPPSPCFAGGSGPPIPPHDIAVTQSVVAGDQLRVTLSVADPAGLEALGLKLHFPDTDVAFDRIEPAFATTSWFLIDAAELTPGQLTVGAFNTTPIASSLTASVFHVYFDFLGAPGTVTGLSVTDLEDNLEGANILTVVTGIDGTPASAAPPRLHQNYPNPFNPATTIRFELASREHIRLDVFTVRGEWVRTLVDATLAPGPHAAAWNGRNATGTPVHSGIYFYRLHTARATESRRMVLLK